MKKIETNGKKVTISGWIKYVIFVIFKTCLTLPFVIGALIPIFITLGNDTAKQGAIICIPISIFLFYDWLRSILLPFWLSDPWKSKCPVWWEGGGINHDDISNGYKNS